MINVGDIYVVIVEAYNSKGQGIARKDGFVIFIDRGIVDEEIEIKIIEKKKSYAVGEIKKIIIASKDRVLSECKVFEKCGGCELQHMSMNEQLRFKENQVKDAIRRIGGYKDAKIENIIKMDNPIEYRNKIQLPIKRVNGKVEIGFYQRKTHKIVTSDYCLLEPKVVSCIKNIIASYMNEFNISAYDEKTRKGLMRGVVIRYSYDTKEIMVILIINGKMIPHKQELIKMLIEKTNTKSIFVNINTQNKNYAFGIEMIKIYGSDYILEKIGDVKYEIYPSMFFQVNSIQMKKLYDKVKEFASNIKNKTLLDLYCGAGTIGIYLSDSFEKVIGIELNKTACKAAKKNAKINGLINYSIIQGKAEDKINEINEDIDTVIIDPPRKGCDQKLLKTLLDILPNQIIYVSCNPSTLARDLYIITKSNQYSIKKIQPVDMFPFTTHVETVVLLSRVEK